MADKVKKIKGTKAVASTGAAAIQLESHDSGAVAIWNLSVLIVPDGDHWFAQGLEINYGAQGDTVQEAKENFQLGLLATIHQHLRIHGDINRILKFAPSEILKEAAQHKANIKKFAQVSFYEILDRGSQTAIPFDGIDYRVLQAA
jgi:hypothetical protein